MKKKIKIIIPVVIVLVMLILCIPLPNKNTGEGVAKEYNAIIYKIIKWDRPLEYVETDTPNHTDTSVFFFGNRYESAEKLWYKELRSIEYPGEWLDEGNKEKVDEEKYYDYERRVGIILAIYSDCFIMGDDYGLNPEIWKVNCNLSEDWCVGDSIACTIEDVYIEEVAEDNIKVEGRLCEIKEHRMSNFAIKKPVIYLYPEEEMEVDVKLDIDGELTCTYPKYNDEWKVVAKPDGRLFDENGLEYSYLYWEAKSNVNFDMSKGFCVKGEDTVKFLEETLDKLGLNRREANDFITYWLPMMESNPYNIIAFQTDVYTDMAKLDIEPAPDTLIRVFMAWATVDEYVDMEPQELTAPERKGFSVVEWGGSKVE